MTPPKLTAGQVYSFFNFDGETCLLIVVEVTDTHVWYKFPTGRQSPLPMTLALWGATRRAHTLVDTIPEQRIAEWLDEQHAALDAAEEPGA